MAGRDPAEALQNFIQPLRQALHCVTAAPLSVPDVRGKTPRPAIEYSAAVGAGLPVQLQGQHRLRLQVGHVFRLIETDDVDRGPIKAQTVRYQYVVNTNDNQELFAYHWAPAAGESGRTFPHMHIGSLVTAGSAFLPKTFSRLHIPTSRVSLESVIRFLIEELEVEPIIEREKALTQLVQSEAAFHRYRTI